MKAIETETLTDRICNTTLRMLAELCIKGDNMQIDHILLSKCLREVVKAGHDQIVADLAEADRAFFGNEAMLNTVLNVGCVELASKAWKQYREAR